MGKAKAWPSNVVKKVIEYREQGFKQSEIAELVTKETGTSMNQVQVSKILIGVGMRSHAKKKKKTKKVYRTRTQKADTPNKVTGLSVNDLMTVVGNANLSTDEKFTMLTLMVKANQ